MKSVFLTIAASLMALSVVADDYDQNKPFGFCTVSSRTDASVTYDITGGGVWTYPLPDGFDASTVKVITSTPGKDMKGDIQNAIKNGNTKVIILDGSAGDFMISKPIGFERGDKTILGINNARLCTQWYLTDEDKTLLDNATAKDKNGNDVVGVKNMSTNSSDNLGGTVNGQSISEQAEYMTRKTLFAKYGNEDYRNAGIFSLNKENVIIRNITFVGPGAVDVGGTDLISATGAKHCWIDHCTFIDGEDGNFDITEASDFITVSWCVFKYTDRSYVHQNTNLVGSSDSKTSDQGLLNTTFAYNWWAPGCKQRMPMARYGKIHMLNNYFSSTIAGNCINPRKNSEFLIDGNNIAPGVAHYYSQNSATAVTWTANNFIAVSSELPSNVGSAVTVPYSNYTVAPCSDVPTLVQTGAGAKLKYGDDTEVTTNGFIQWAFNTGVEGQTSTLNGLAAEGIGETSVTLGSHLTYAGKKTSDIAMTGFTINDTSSDDEANAGNAVCFNFTVKDGYTFNPTNVMFYATRFGTDNGKFSSYLSYADKTQYDVCGETLAYRDNGKTSSSDATATPKHSEVNVATDDAKAMTGKNALVIHLYNIPYNEANPKSVGLANIVISGYVKNLTTDITTPVRFSAPANVYYNLSGQRVDKPTRGIYIVGGRKVVIR